jgi:hypothetical protein
VSKLFSKRNHTIYDTDTIETPNEEVDFGGDKVIWRNN